ncbi:MAG: universal stress protein [Clostridia bacterium]|nr:universal stress protein [Clostridia bacterium]
MKVLVAVDGSETAKKAVAYVAERLADRPGLEVTLVHVTEPLEVLYGYGFEYVNQDMVNRFEAEGAELARRVLDEAGGILEKVGIQPRKVVRRGHPAQEIVRLAQEGAYDLVVVGSRGLGQLGSLFLGSVSDRVVHLAQCPVLVIR